MKIRKLATRFVLVFIILSPILLTAPATHSHQATANEQLHFKFIPVAWEEEYELTLHFFWEEGCPACARERTFLRGLQLRYPQIQVIEHEVDWISGLNVGFLELMCEQHGVLKEHCKLPLLFIENSYICGYFGDETTGADIEDLVRRFLGGRPSGRERTIPLLGKVDLAKVGLPLFTLTVACLDSVNPCTIWVLSFLLTLLVIHARSRRRVLVVGLAFVATIALIYFLFMSALLTIFEFVGLLGWVRVAVGAVAMIVGIINLKEFFAFKRWVSLTISKRVKPILVRRMRGVVRRGTIPAMMVGAICLAAFASLVEIPCTVGFPVIYTQALRLQGLSTPVYLSYLAAYTLIYSVPLLLLVGIFAHSLSGRKFTERQGRILKAVGGLMMVALGFIFVVRPELLAFR